MFGGSYEGRRVLVTGHTGFKGSWLALWLQSLGAQVTGAALPPATNPSHWDLLRLDMESFEVDIRDAGAVRALIQRVRPDIVFHLAAQALVRPSYEDPLGTWSTNVMGTAHVLDACRQVDSVAAVVVATSDKCYANHEWAWPYRENDPLGGHDPYSASKAGTELVAASYRASYFANGGPRLATARAGNVIGGGDWSADRLVPDAARAVGQGATLQVRNPNATRPWQHVLEPLSGYLVLGQKLLHGDAAAADAWNFGPGPEGNKSVGVVLQELAAHWRELRWEQVDGPRPHEAQLLQVDSSKARQQLAWKPAWSFERAVAATASWYRSHGEEGRAISVQQLHDYIDSAAAAGVAWAQP